MIKFLKKAVKWYFQKSANAYTWMPTGCAYIRDIEA